jgi:GNAT superfamily N-acetyltransferase
MEGVGLPWILSHPSASFLLAIGLRKRDIYIRTVSRDLPLPRLSAQMTLQQLLDPITREDVKKAYDFQTQASDNKNVIELSLVCHFDSIGERKGPPPYVQYRFDLLKQDKKSILQFLAQRRLTPEETLLSSVNAGEPRTGKVATNCQFFLEPEFQGRGIGRLVYDLEERLYETWGAEEIQLDAVQAGRVVWRHFGFTVTTNDLRWIESMYEMWCKAGGIAYSETMDIMAYPDEFLLSKVVRHISMYKEI